MGRGSRTAQGRRPTPRDLPVGPAAPRTGPLPARAVRRPATWLVRPGEAARGTPGRRRPHPDPDPHRVRRVARDPHRDGDRRDLLHPLCERPPRPGGRIWGK